MTNKQRHLTSVAGYAVAAFTLLALPLALVEPPRAQDKKDETGPSAKQLLSVPVTSQRIGGAEAQAPLKPPTNLEDPEAIQRGMDYFNQMNCVGCHAPNGGGGMGPSLSNSIFVYGGDPANIYLSIAQGRPKGMPAWGDLLPASAIWDLVAYVRSISKDAPAWGETVSPTGFKIEQVPADEISTPDPWAHTRPFSFGRPPQTAGTTKEDEPAETKSPSPEGQK